MRKNSVLKHIFQSAWPFKLYLSLHLFVVLFNAIDISLWPFISKLLIDKLAVAPRDQIFGEIWLVTLIFILLTILPGLVWRVADYGWTYLTPLMRKKVMVDATDKMLKKSQNFYQNNQAGACANRIKELVNNTPSLLEVILYNFLGIFLTLVIAFFTLWHTHKFFAITLVIWATLFIFMAIRCAKLTDKMSCDLASQQARIMGNVVDVFTNIQNVKFFTNQEKEQNRINYLQNRYTIFFKHRGFFLLKFYTLHGLTFSLYFSASVIALIYFYSKSLVTLGDFMLIFTVNSWMINAMWIAANQMKRFLEEFGAAKQSLKMLDKPLEVKDVEDAKDLKLLRKKGAEIVFENVSFSYKSLEQPSKDFKPVDSQIFAKLDAKNSILDEEEGDLVINEKLVIKRGEKVGLVGHSGGGKSTFINLLMRSYDVNRGRISIDGQDISGVRQNSLRRAITIIPQDPMLFHRTIYENIAYAKKDAKEEEIIAAAKKAHCHKFIERMKKGYRTLVGDRGIKLSGGQRQRIAIARAFLENAPILIMDEGTSQLDSITENLIQSGLEKLTKTRTAIIVAHRLATLKNVDRILVFDQGTIIEQGCHEDLMEQDGVYKKMWDRQIGGFFGE